jgi:biotin synthase
MTEREITVWLRENSTAKLQSLWDMADKVRAEHVGDYVHLRGLVEISNHCVRRCAYCGLNSTRHGLSRYRMTADEVMDCARLAVDLGYGTVVLQSGEDYGLTAEWVRDIVRRIKDETPLAVTLSLGERSDDELLLWRSAGADRYLLRFETSDPHLYVRIHPSLRERVSDRIAMLRRLRAFGYEVGSGVMVGIPGQTIGVLARDIMLFRELDLDMIGVGPYLPHPDTPLALAADAVADQAPRTELMVYKVVALARLACPEANIPSTTALATMNRRDGRELGLQRGANVVMPNLTPTRYRALYEIYPNKVCVDENADACAGCLKARIERIGRRVGAGRGSRRSKAMRAMAGSAPGHR